MSKRRRQLGPRDMGAPLSGFSLEITNKCPNDCVMCSRSTVLKEKPKNMTPAQMGKILGSVRRSKLVTRRSWVHFGVAGDPLAHPQVADMVRGVAASGFERLMVYSSLVCSDKRFAEFLAAASEGVLTHVKLSATQFWSVKGKVDRKTFYDRARLLDRAIGQRLSFNICAPRLDLIESTCREVAFEVGRPLAAMNGHLPTDLFSTHGLPARCQCQERNKCSAASRHINVYGDLKLCCHDLAGMTTFGNVLNEGFRACWIRKVELFHGIANATRNWPDHCLICASMPSFRKQIEGGFTL